MHRAGFGALIIYYLIISSLPHYSQFSHYCVQHNTLLLAAGCCALQSQICSVSVGNTLVAGGTVQHRQGLKMLSELISVLVL